MDQWPTQRSSKTALALVQTTIASNSGVEITDSAQRRTTLTLGLLTPLTAEE